MTDDLNSENFEIRNQQIGVHMARSVKKGTVH